MKKVKVGYIGLGRRGRAVLDQCVSLMADVEIVALCDTHQPHLEKGDEIVKKNANYSPKLTNDAEEIFNDPTIEAVFIMTPWDDRAELVKRSMRAGKYTGFEVGCVFRIEECFEILEVYKETKTPVMLLENCCYGRREMMALNMLEKGMFGEVVHCDGGYHHYLNDVELFREELKDKYEEETLHHYRIDSYISRNCETYPTHELGPISKVLKLNRGNRMLTLSSFASKARGLKSFAKRHLGEDNKYANIDYAQGDIVTTIITCENGETIRLCLDTTLPRAYYSRGFTVRGTEGMYTEDRKVAFFEGMEEGISDNEKEMMEKYDHPLHEEYEKLGVTGGHGGMDWLVCRAFIESVKNGTDTPIDIYDSLLWISIAPLSEQSIKMGGAPVEVPDFTEGKYKDREPIVEGKYCLDKVCVDKNTKIFPDKE